MFAATATTAGRALDDQALRQFTERVAPILRERCYECHGDGARKGGIAFDELTTKDKLLHDPGLWLKVLRNTRSQIMPPPGETAPTPAEQRALEQW
ncbi:MAG TPA: c-type cytochrome domain-containing protein, partial [Opitutaceae bacterium]|nr:c-type cytochrome domain-containing protein [Opitutaceae bacterium]